MAAPQRRQLSDAAAMRGGYGSGRTTKGATAAAPRSSLEEQDQDQDDDDQREQPSADVHVIPSVVACSRYNGDQRAAVTGPATMAARGDVAEWLGRGLQSLARRFDSGRRLARPPTALASGWMRRVALIVLPAVAGCALAAGGGAAVGAAPPGPNLALVALAPKDVGGGARTVRQGAVRSPGYQAAFERELEFGSGVFGRSVLFYLTSTVELARVPATTDAELDTVRARLAKRPGRVAMVKSIEAELRQTLGDSLEAAAMGTIRYPRIGGGAIVVPISVTTTDGRLQLVLTYLRVDRVLVTTSVAGDPVTRADLDRLLALTAGKAVAELGPVAVSSPSIAGEARAGAQLTASSGSWRNRPTGYAYRWSRCDPSGAQCVRLPGPSLATYAVTSADVGTTLRVTVTARNGAGSKKAISPPTAVVAPA
jgi:hypothetical protein